MKKLSLIVLGMAIQSFSLIAIVETGIVEDARLFYQVCLYSGIAFIVTAIVLWKNKMMERDYE